MAEATDHLLVMGVLTFQGPGPNYFTHQAIAR